MGTNYDGAETDDMGVIPRAVTDIFDQIDDLKQYDFRISCAFLELYQERLYDLLSPKSRENSTVDIRETGGNQITIPNLTEVDVKTPRETINCLIKASGDRSVAATAMNAQSSRSHAIFTISINKVATVYPIALKFM